MITLETDGSIHYKGVTIGRHTHSADGDTVEITLTYRTPPGDWGVPLSWLAHGLALIEPPGPLPVLQIECSEEEAELIEGAPRLLTEKKLKGAGYIWVFHKSDPDQWPSPFHGHDYEQGLKIDAITGDIFVVATRQKFGALKFKELKRLQQKLRKCKDLSARADAHLPAPG